MKQKVMDEKTLKKLHEVEIEILDEFVRICKKYKLNYFLLLSSNNDTFDINYSTNYCYSNNISSFPENNK